MGTCSADLSHLARSLPASFSPSLHGTAHRRSGWTVPRMLSCLPSTVTPRLIYASLCSNVQRLCHQPCSPSKANCCLQGIWLAHYVHIIRCCSLYTDAGGEKNSIIIASSSLAILRRLRPHITKPRYLYHHAYGSPSPPVRWQSNMRPEKNYSPPFKHALILAVYLCWTQAKFINNFWVRKKQF